MEFLDCLRGAVAYSYPTVDLLWDNVIAGPWGWPRSTVLAKSRPVTNPSAGRDTYADGVNFQLRNATPRWSVSHDAPQAIMRRDKSRAGRGVYRMREPMIPVNKLSTSGIDEHWHKCADEARSVADDMKDEISKQMMLQIANDYERLAKRAAHREPGGRLIG